MIKCYTRTESKFETAATIEMLHSTNSDHILKRKYLIYNTRVQGIYIA